MFQWNTTRTLVMGILNVTPDSFYDGGRGDHVARARALAAAGADIIDIGGESSRPGSQPVSVAEELQRVLPIIKSLPDLLVSIDTTKPEVARQAVAAGARIINDISASLFAPARETGAGLVLMHMQGTPATMQQAPRYADVVREVHDFLADRIAAAEAHGVQKSQIAVDPGIGFGKTAEHNRQLLARLKEFGDLGCPVLVGASRKSFLGGAVADRLPGSLAVAGWAVAQGVRVVRVHDVAATVAVVRLIEQLQTCNV
ncbi:MAG: Dihydropteroate synthase [Verrucomicrobiae bacterium]|nr:Dihydropteroate synthase [Verrucomicrobiae bacterium]